MLKQLTVLLLICIATSAAVPDKRIMEPWRVQRIVFSGNTTFKEYYLRNMMDLKPLLFHKKQRFSPSKLKSDIAQIKQFYINQGFLKITVHDSVERDTTHKHVVIFLSITEGNRTSIASVGFSGKIPDSLVRQNMQCKQGAFLQQSKIQKDEQLLRTTLKNGGYLFPHIITRHTMDSTPHGIRLDFYTHSGPLVIADSIRLTGVEKLKPHVILRELSFKKGDTLYAERLKKTEKKLYRTNLVNAVNIEPLITDTITLRDTGSRHYPVSIGIKEANFFKLKVGAGYGSNEGLRGSLETSYSNLFRLGHRFALKGNLSERIQQVQTIYSTPWFLGIPFRFDGMLFYNKFNNPDTYKGEFQGIRLSLEKPLLDNIILQFLTRFEDVVWITSDDLPSEYPRNNTQSFGIDFIYDTRNDLLDPLQGLYMLNKVELAGITGIKSNQFIKLTSDTRCYWQLGPCFFASGIKAGWVQPYGNSTIVPLPDQFYAGGSKSVRGFRDNFLLTASDSANHAKSGMIMLTSNIIEMRIKLFWLISGALFLDAGYLTDHVRDVSFNALKRQIRVSAGPGLRLSTPLAIIRVDLGCKLDKREYESPTEWHIDIGQSF